MSPLLTIVIPTRDRVEFLKRCLDSVFARKSEFVPVVVSDNSTTESSGIAGLKATYPFQYVRQSGELTMFEHHNACLDLVETRWALLLHDDDELAPECLKAVTTFLEDCAAGVVVGGFERIDENSVVHACWRPDAAELLRGEEGVLRLGLDYKANPQSTIYNVAAFRNVGGFPDALGASADYPLILHLTFLDGLALFPQVIGRYRVGAHQGTDFSLSGAERTLDCTIAMSHLTQTIGVSERVAERLIDYNVWWIFRIIAGQWFWAKPLFVHRLFRKCYAATPVAGPWKTQIQQEFPMLLWRPAWFWLPLRKLTKSILPLRLQLKLRRAALK